MTDYVRDVLLRMPSIDRRAISAAAIRKANSDPENLELLTPILWAVHSSIVDLETEETELLARADE